MDASTWVAIVALVVAAAGPTAVTLRGSGRREGKLDAAIEQLTQITSDHENRLRKRGL